MRVVLLFFSCCFWIAVIAQKPKLTTVIGQVTDALTGEPLPYVDVYFAGTTVGTNTDVDGKYRLQSQWGSDLVVASYLGYQPDTVKIIVGSRNTKINFKLGEGAYTLNTVEVKVKKRRYRNKNNPAVALIRKVLAHRDQNRLKSLDYYQYEKYEKLELDINNITDEFRNSKTFRKLQFIFDYVDTSSINGKPYLPIYFREIISDVYYRGRDANLKEYQKAIKYTGLKEYLNEQTISSLMDRLYMDIDIYDNTINLMGQNFTSPIAPLAPQIYKYYILDTLEYKGRQVYHLAFLPRNNLDFAFKGSMYISFDENYAVQRVEMGIDNRINLNFVRDLHVVHEFEQIDGAWVLQKDELVVDYGTGNKGTGFFGRRSIERRNHKINQKIADELFLPTERIFVVEDAKEHKEDYWETQRFNELSESEKGVYHMIDTLQKVPAFKRTLNLIKLGLTGHLTASKVDIGPVGAFYSFNEVEGFRLRFGGQTNLKFNEKIRLRAYGAYGFRDKAYKYSGVFRYSFQKDFEDNPKHYIEASIQRETSFPGQALRFVNEDNFFLSFKRGPIDKMLFFDSYKIEYLKETKTAFDYRLTVENRKTRPYGTLKFLKQNEGVDPYEISEFTTTEISFNLRYAPNEQFWQGYTYRVPLFNKYPIININYAAGFKGLLGGQYNYHHLNASIFKRLNLNILGETNVLVEGGKYFGEGIPFTNLHLPNANQTFAYQIYSYNLMNFLEFVSDEYVSLNIQHFFKGFFFNKIPLLKRLKFREIITLKMLYGRLTDDNNPERNTESFMLPQSEGVQTTFVLTEGPYVESSVGISNILKFGRIDLVKRFTYLDNPNIPTLWGVKGLGIRARIKLEF